MAGFKNGAVAIKKKDSGINADPNFINILVDTSNNLYTIDEFGVYRGIAGFDVVSSGSDISVITSGGTKVLSLNSTGVISGTYGNATTVPQIVIDNNGRILSAFSVPISASGLGTVTSVSISSNTLNVINSPITTFGTFGVNLSATGVVSGSILKPFVDSYGRVLSGGLISATDISDRSTDVSLSANSDNKIPTEKAIKTYVDNKRLYISTGISVTPPPIFINNNDGTLTIEPTICRLYSTTDFTGNIEQYNILGATLSLTDGIEQHICIKYNSGNPIYYVENFDSNINDSDIICVYIVWRQGLEIHSINMDSLGLGLGNKTLHSINNTTPYRKSYLGGLVINETASPSNRTIVVTSGNVYAGVVDQLVLPFDSSIDRLTLVYHNSGNWLYSDNMTYNNTQYDNGINLATIGNNKFSVRWYYRSIGDVKQTFYVLGNSEHHTISEARLESPRTDLPILLNRHCILVGRSIIEYNANNGITEPVSDISIAQSNVQIHNDLTNIQGGGSGNYFHVSATTFEYLSAVSADIQLQLNSKLEMSNISALQEPTGFVNKDQFVQFSSLTNTFSISASGGFTFYFRGKRFDKISDSVVLTTATSLGSWFIWYTSAGILTATQTPWDLSQSIPVVYIYKNSNKLVLFGEERHGCVMDWATHKHFHASFGTQYTSGFNATYTLNNDNFVNFGLSNGIIDDEDIELKIVDGIKNTYLQQPLSTSAQIPVYYRNSLSQGIWDKDDAGSLPYKNTGTTGISYNNGNTQTLVTNNYYVAYWIFATNNMSEPIIAIQGQRQDMLLSDARTNASFASLNLTDFPAQEAKLLYRIILETRPSYTGNIYRVRIAEVNDYRYQQINLITQSQILPSQPVNEIVVGSGSGITSYSTHKLYSNATGFSGIEIVQTTSASQGSYIGLSSPNNTSGGWYLQKRDISTYGSTSGSFIIEDSLGGATASRYPMIIESGSNGLVRFNRNVSAFGTLSASQEIQTLTTFKSRLAGNVASIILNSNGNWLGIGSDGSSTNTIKIGNTLGTSTWNGVANLLVTGNISADGTLKYNGGVFQDLVQAAAVAAFYPSGVVPSSGTIYNYGLAFTKNAQDGYLNGTISSSLAVNGAQIARATSAGLNVTGNLTATSIIKSGGLSTQFLKADGSTDSNVYVTTATISRPVNEIVYGSGSGITSSPIFKNYPNATGFSGIEIYQTTSASQGAYLGFITPNNTSGGWYLQKRDISTYGSVLGSFVIEDSLAGFNISRFAMIIESGSNGLVRFNRNVSGANNISASQEIQTLTTFKSRLAGNVASIILNSNGNWLGIGSDGSSSNVIKIGNTTGTSTWNGVANLLVTGNISADGTLKYNGGIFRDLVQGSSYTAFYPSGVIPSTGTTYNYGLAFATNGLEGYLNGTSNSNLAVNGTPIARATSAGLNITGNLTATGYATITGNISAANVFTNNITATGNYYVNAYSGGGSPALITNAGNARFYTLTLNEMNTTTDTSLKFLDAGFGAPAGSFFSFGGKANAIRLAGFGNSNYSGIFFGNTTKEYIGSKGDSSLHLGADADINLLATGNVRINSQNRVYINSLASVEISSTIQAVQILGIGAIIDVTGAVSVYGGSFGVDVPGTIVISNTTNYGIVLNTYGFVYSNGSSGTYSNGYACPKLFVSATSVSAIGLSITDIPRGFDFVELQQPTGSSYKNYRLSNPGANVCKTIKCFTGGSGPINHSVIYPSIGSNMFDKNGDPLSYFSNGSIGGVVCFSYDGGNWWVT